MILKIILIFSLLVVSNYSRATTSTDKPIKTAAYVNGLTMATPIMPIQMEPKGGRHSFSIRPAIFEGDTGGVQEYDGARFSAEFEGQGLALMYHWQINSFLGFYGLGMYNQITDGSFLGRGDDPSDPQQDVVSSEVEASFLQIGTGLSFQLVSTKFFAMQLMAGPTFTQAEASQRVTQEHPANPDDFIMEVNPSIVGLLAGVQLGFRIFDNLMISPYYQTSIPAGETCVEYTTQVTTHGDLKDISDPECNGDQNDTLLQYDTSFSSFGVNLAFPEWGLSINLLSEVEEIQGIEGTETTLFFLTLTI